MSYPYRTSNGPREKSSVLAPASVPRIGGRWTDRQLPFRGFVLPQETTKTMRSILRICSFAGAVLLTSVFAPKVSAQLDITIPGGTDFLYTQPGTLYNSPFGPIPLVGNPVLPGGTDTEVFRNGDADATTGAPITTQLLSLNLVGTGAFSGVSVTLDPNNLPNDTGTMSFSVTTPVVPGTQIGGSITDTLNVFYLATLPGGGTVTGEEMFTSSGTWTAFLPAGATEVTDFKIIIDTHVDPSGDIHIVSSFAVPEPSTWIMLLTAGVIVPVSTRWRRRRA